MQAKNVVYVGAAHAYDGIVALLIGRAYVRYSKLDYARWAAESGIAEATLRRRIADPKDLTLDELRQMTRPLEIHGDELRAVLPF